MSIEALWAGNIQDFTGNWLNGGVVIFESGRAFGGDGAYYYVGRYTVSGETLKSEMRIVHYAGVPNTVWGDNNRDFTINVTAKIIDGDKLVGTLTRPDEPGMKLKFHASKKADLP